MPHAPAVQYVASFLVALTTSTLPIPHDQLSLKIMFGAFGLGLIREQSVAASVRHCSVMLYPSDGYLRCQSSTNAACAFKQTACGSVRDLYAPSFRVSAQCRRPFLLFMSGNMQCDQRYWGMHRGHRCRQHGIIGGCSLQVGGDKQSDSCELCGRCSTDSLALR